MEVFGFRYDSYATSYSIKIVEVGKFTKRTRKRTVRFELKMMRIEEKKYFEKKIHLLYYKI